MIDMGKWHELKINTVHHKHVRAENPMDRKTVEIRLNDRDFQKGDYLKLREFSYENQDYTGAESHVVITHILDDVHYVPVGYVALSILLIYPSRWE
jgi:hypothetical protein